MIDIDINYINSHIDDTVERMLSWKNWHDDGNSYKKGIEDLGIFADFEDNKCVNTGIYREENKELDVMYSKARIRILFQNFDWNQENLKSALLKKIKTLIAEYRKKEMEQDFVFNTRSIQ